MNRRRRSLLVGAPDPVEKREECAESYRTIGLRRLRVQLFVIIFTQLRASGVPLPTSNFGR